jgi:predicted nucleic acid-binding protein
MFCADSSSWIAYLSGESGDDVDLLDLCLRNQFILMAPIVLAELLSDPLLPDEVEAHLRSVPVLELRPGFWERAGKTRAELIKRKMKPKLADTLIAQVCIDHNLPLHTRDTDFRPFAKYAGLQLVMHGLVN